MRLGIGINTGTVIAGTVGGGGRLEFTVIGDTVNTAARVEALTKETGDHILITEAARRALPAPQRGAVRRSPRSPLRVAAGGRHDHELGQPHGPGWISINPEVSLQIERLPSSDGFVHRVGGALHGRWCRTQQRRLFDREARFAAVSKSVLHSQA